MAESALAKTRETRHRTQGVLLVATAGALFSTLGLGVRLMEEASAWQIVFYRGLFQAAAVTAMVLYRDRSGLREPFRRIGWAGLVAALALAAAYNGMILALTLTSVATVAFVFSAAPLVTGLLAWWILGERLKPTTFAAMGLAAVGIVVMSVGQPAGRSTLGMLAAAIAVLGAAIFTIALRRGKGVDMLPAIALSGVLAALMSSVAIDSFAMTRADLVLSFYLGAIALALGLALFTAGSRRLTAVELQLVALTESVLAPLWVWLLLGEAVGLMTLLGGGIVLAAVALQSMFGGQREA